MNSSSTTIAALATAPYPAGLAVVRVSGPDTKSAFRTLFRSKKDPVLNPRLAILGDIVDFKTGDVIDRALAIYMPGPYSFTGEDVGEFQFHGSPLLVQKILRSLYASGIQPAEAGEFTKRAFLLGKLDLVQAEAIADLINASSEQALKLAGEQLKGRLSSVISELGDPLRDVLAELEALIDFSDEDIQPESVSSLMSRVERSVVKVESLLESYSYGHVVKEGFRVLLYGKPNVGKSSILNLLLGKSRAIVTDIAGTTRDLIEEEVMLGDYKFIFCDSAGISDTEDKVEKIGVSLSKERIEWADLVLLIVDASDSSEEWKLLIDDLRDKTKRLWMITNKVDLNPSAIGTFYCDLQTCQQNFYLSAKTKAGFEALVEALKDEVTNTVTTSSEASGIITNERHRTCLEKCRDSLERAVRGHKTNYPVEIISTDIRIALSSLDELIGKTTPDDILGRIFSRFCIGK